MANGYCGTLLNSNQNKSKRQMLNILHVASFTGNLGDNFNHMGLVPWIENLIGTPVRWTRLEIRKFYWKQLHWDESFVDYANKFDLIIIGGGNYFELWVDKSPTGTSIEIEPHVYSRIKKPIFFNSLGVDAGQGATQDCIMKFRNFIDTIVEGRNALVSVRNDGARDTIKNTIGKNYIPVFNSLPDHGFFVEKQHINLTGSHPSKYICINLACDMPRLRFSNISGGIDGFASSISNTIKNIEAEYPDHHFIFVPHMYGDLKIIFDVLECLPDYIRRGKVQVYKYGTGDCLAREVLNLYENSKLAIGMRFHANVCPLALGVPNFGVATYPQINLLYEELALQDRVFEVSRSTFSTDLASACMSVLKSPAKITAQSASALMDVKSQREEFSSVFRKWWSEL